MHKVNVWILLKKSKRRYWGISNPSLERLTDTTLEGLLTCKVSEEQKRLLGADTSHDKIKSTVFLLPGKKAPGPDGYTSDFFQAFMEPGGK